MRSRPAQLGARTMRGDLDCGGKRSATPLWIRGRQAKVLSPLRSASALQMLRPVTISQWCVCKVAPGRSYAQLIPRPGLRLSIYSAGSIVTTLPRLPPPAAFTLAARPLVAALAALALCGCRSVPVQSPIDFSGPGWNLREGQVVWRPRAGADGIAGDLLVATHPDGRSVVQFTKTPLPFLVAQRTADRWQAQIIPRNKTYSGRGAPPARLIWLHLPEALARGDAPDGFRFTTNTSGGWRFERRATGESLEGYLELRATPRTP